MKTNPATAERERCAQIAEVYAFLADAFDDASAAELARHIAKVIRCEWPLSAAP